jgi:pimeloyl-ACP methyl ester carboxylesterase
MRWIRWSAIIAGAAMLIGVGFERAGEARDARLVPPPGRLIAVGDHRLHLWCIGNGSPTVVLISGGGTPSVTLYSAQTRIARFTRVCSYDRAGLGWSDPATKPMSVPEMADDLAALLATARVGGPYVLAPESFGGLVALSFAARQSTHVAGAVFIDASEPGLWFRVSPHEVDAARRTNLLWQAGWRLGIIRAFLPLGLPAWAAALPLGLRAEFAAVWSKPMPGFTEWIGALERTRVGERPTSIPGMLSPKPIIVISHGLSGGMGMSSAFADSWPAAQRRLAALSTDSHTLIAVENHHAVAEENPQLVGDAVKWIVVQLRNGRLPLRSAALPRSGVTTPREPATTPP